MTEKNVNLQEIEISKKEIEKIGGLNDEQTKKVTELGRLELEVERRKAELIVDIQRISQEYLKNVEEIKKNHKISKEAVITKIDFENNKIVYVESKRK